MLITVSGPPGSGKSTNAAGLADRLGLDHVSGGDIFREMAAERDMTPVEFNEFAEEDPQIDRDLDRRLHEIATTRDDLVLESRLAGWLSADRADFRFWFDAPVSIRAERIAEREGKPVDRAKAETERREASEKKRYRGYYDIDIDDLSIYDAAYNTARWGPEPFIDVLVATIDAYDPATDEGKAPIEGVSYEF
ncbi:cytidylate kinase [Halorubrum saccharovorum]|uniref:Cytidylate kinase n=1 Tax=Halorubrum saccharovorum TaxID=2248 RepID=A0A081EVH9_9EURY|nr:MULTISPECIES: AAA family ATPase [Halorubrum]KDS91417.1 cytidylate kinase [Halorubrum saccharovorum]